MYWVGQKVHEDFSVTSYGKIWTKFLANAVSLSSWQLLVVSHGLHPHLMLYETQRQGYLEENSSLHAKRCEGVSIQKNWFFKQKPRGWDIGWRSWDQGVTWQWGVGRWADEEGGKFLHHPQGSPSLPELPPRKPAFLLNFLSFNKYVLSASHPLSTLSAKSWGHGSEQSRQVLLGLIFRSGGTQHS